MLRLADAADLMDEHRIRRIPVCWMGMVFWMGIVSDSDVHGSRDRGQPAQRV